MDEVKSVRVTVLGARNYPVAHEAKIPEHLVKDFKTLVEQAQRYNPALTAEHVIRGIWRYGSREMDKTLSHPLNAKNFLAGELPDLVKPRVPVAPPQPTATFQTGDYDAHRGGSAAEGSRGGVGAGGHRDEDSSPEATAIGAVGGSPLD